MIKIITTYGQLLLLAIGADPAACILRFDFSRVFWE